MNEFGIFDYLNLSRIAGINKDAFPNAPKLQTTSEETHGAPEGTIHTWADGNRYKKIKNGVWERQVDGSVSHGKHEKIEQHYAKNNPNQSLSHTALMAKVQFDAPDDALGYSKQREEGQIHIKRLQAHFKQAEKEEHPNLKTNIDAIGRFIHGMTKKRKVEFATIVSNQSGKSGPLLQGKEGAVELSALFPDMNSDSSYTQIHTHPGTASFSGADLNFFAGIPQVTRMSVYGKDNIFTLEKPKGWQSRFMERPHRIGSDYDSFVNEMMPQYDPGVLPDGSRDEEKDAEAWGRQTHDAMGKFARVHDLIYRRKPIGGGAHGHTS